jgi:hypothetical protein
MIKVGVKKSKRYMFEDGGSSQLYYIDFFLSMDNQLKEQRKYHMTCFFCSFLYLADVKYKITDEV